MVSIAKRTMTVSFWHVLLTKEKQGHPHEPSLLVRISDAAQGTLLDALSAMESTQKAGSRK